MDFSRHAEEAADAERPRITAQAIEQTLDDPDHDDHKTAIKRIKGRTIIVRYSERQEAIYIITVSATRSPLRP